MRIDDRAAARIPALPRDRAGTVVEAQVEAFREAVAELDGADWELPTDSAGWRVHDVVAHVGGQCEEVARIGTFLRRLRTARQRYPDRTVLDGHNQVQLDELAARSPAALVAHLERFGPAGVRAIQRMPALLRRLPSTLFFPEPPLPERSLAYLFDVIAPRDVWMHRLELARATGRPYTPRPHDVDVVAQVVRDLDRFWTGPPVTLALTGPGAGTWRIGGDHGDTGQPETVDADAVELMLHLSGRPSSSALAGGPLGDARVVF